MIAKVLNHQSCTVLYALSIATVHTHICYFWNHISNMFSTQNYYTVNIKCLLASYRYAYSYIMDASTDNINTFTEYQFAL